MLFRAIRTSFITPTGNYHFKVMPFELKNVGSTFQRIVTKIFGGQLGRNKEAYIDDMVVKSEIVGDHFLDLTETYEMLKQHHLKLNAFKCAEQNPEQTPLKLNAFKRLGNFLNYLVTHWGIEVNPEQNSTLQNLGLSRSPKEVQRLTWMIAALNCFISKFTDKMKQK